MDSVTRYAAVGTKIRALQREFLSNDDYIALLEKKSVPEVAIYLKEHTAYKDMLSDVDTDGIRRGYLEKLLKKNMIYNVDKITHYFNGGYKQFIKALYMKYEIEDFKKLARIVNNGDYGENDEVNISFIGKYTGLDMAKFMKARSFEDVVYAFKSSPFFDYLEPLLWEVREGKLFQFEMILDMAYYSIVQKAWNKLDKIDKQIVQKIEGAFADLLNLQWIYRGLKFYRLSPEELFNYTIAFGDAFTYGDIKALCYVNSLDELYEAIMKTKYAFLFNKEQTRDIYMERRILRYIYYKLLRLKRAGAMNIANIIAYIWSLEFEIRDIITIVECIRYDITMKDAEKFLIKYIT